ncbi:leucine-rich repeat domain-containing protein [Anaerosacchariphilus polymeriproducens]|uniref:Leucine-rich repeat domain-containing protein n=1 Tax=Anaerosacchariphilus polymeriproducens TaxID=1812858 RepID=A0A371AXD7_9FIRM|nr:leucine-rich repeat domain-containing protein [Anaerosacchariphilus polymeriproducens]RDU24236.1 leucine-rich repeat domain-containing protein [Anaerosacchariphilus polymeriproducens]
MKIRNYVILTFAGVFLVGCQTNHTKDSSLNKTFVYDNNENQSNEVTEEMSLPDKKIDFWDGKYAYEILASSEICLTNVEGEDNKEGISKKIKSSTIPVKATYKNKEYMVSRIGEGAFISCKNLNDLIMPDSVKEIDKSAFAYCESLKGITFSNELQRIGNGAFVFTSVAELKFGDKLSFIEEAAFSFCKSLKKVDLPESVKVIEKGAFSSCLNLQEVTIRARKLNMEEKVFVKCNSLKTFYVPKESIEYYKKALNEYKAEVKAIEE